MDIKEMVEDVLLDDPVKTITKKGESRLEIVSTDNDVKTDYNYARENYYNLMEKGHEALDELLEIAKSSEHARHFEVVSQLIKNLGDTNEKLLGLQKTKKELIKENPNGPTNVNNNLFVGSTSDLLKMLKNNKKGLEEEK
jgi:predicted house-cleaning noncanonical NTP pyrophosphatase (MazG superfamily)